MSTTAQKLTARRVLVSTSPLEVRIETLGIPVPDQVHARHMMECARLGLPLNASQRRVKYAFFRRWRAPKWKIFYFGEYRNVRDFTWGAPMPPQLQGRVSKILGWIPGSSVKVYALPKDDPWIEVILKNESCVVGAWIRSPYQECKIIF